MQTRTAVCVLLLAEGLGQETVWGQTRPKPAVRTQIAPTSMSARAKKPLPAASRPLPATAKPSNAVSVAPSYLLRTPEAPNLQDGLRMHRLMPLYTWENTPFTTQVRVPVADFWDGRVQVACFHQRVRGGNVYSAIPRSEMAHVAQPAVVTPGQRGYENYGVGVWLRIGRSRGVQASAARPGQSPAAPVH